MKVTLWITTAIHLDTPKSGLDPFFIFFFFQASDPTTESNCLNSPSVAAIILFVSAPGVASAPLTSGMWGGEAVRTIPWLGTLLVFLVLQRNRDLVEDAGLNVTSKPLYLCYQIAQVLG